MQVYGNSAIDATDYKHTVLRVTMKNREKYALDMAGAQYGWYECVTPWHLYRDAKVRSIKEVCQFDATRAFCKTRAENMGGQRKRIENIKENFTKCLDETVVGWQSRKNISLSTMLRLPEAEFGKKQSSLIDDVNERLQRYKAMNELIGAFDIIGNLKVGAFDRKYSSSALGIIPGRGGPPSGTT